MKIPSKTLFLFSILFGVSGAFANPLPDAAVAKAAGEIDSLVLADLETAGLTANPEIDDGTFVRRAYLGIVGRIPSEEEARNFLGSGEEGKREALIDSLVASPGFDSHLFNWAADLLRVKTKQEQFGLGWHVWLRKSLADDKPWDTLVREMLSATGHTADNPAVGYYLRDRNMKLDNFSNSMQVFLGRQMGCAQCHDHPFDDWTQLEYFQMAAFTGGTNYRSKEADTVIQRAVADVLETPQSTEGEDRKRLKRKLQAEKRKLTQSLRPVFNDFNKNAISENPTGKLRLPDDYKYGDAKPKAVVEPETLFGKRISGVDDSERKGAFAGWVTSTENPFFTKVIVNRLWARAFGHGLLDPVDDWSDDSKPAHPEVLAYLEETMKELDYDMRQFSRILFRTQLFQRECEAVEPPPGVPHLVRGPRLQRMSAEQLYDSLLVLRHGEVDDSVSRKGGQRWDQYKAHIQGLLDMGSEELLELGETATKAESDFRETQGIKLKLERKIKEAAGDEKKVKELKADLAETRREINRLNKMRNPGRFDGKQMMMGGGNAERQKMSLLRASEQPAPFNPGSLVRDFGGSDRETPGSGNTVATVPQALTLLNDWDAEVMGRKFYLGKKLEKLSPEERLETIFLVLYSRLPTEQERAKYTTYAEKQVGWRDLGHAMLTSDRFIFIQ